MWIAKPLRSLNAAEQLAWCGVLQKSRQKGAETPLAQSLAWGRAIEAVGGQVYLVFSPEEKVGGLLFATATEAGLKFECVNGPLLDWDRPDAIKPQLALFATAVTRLSPRFASMILRPRWIKVEARKRLSVLPLEPQSTSFAATLKLPLAAETPPESHFSPRLRRTLKSSDQAGIIAKWQSLDPSNLVEFVLAAQAFGRAHGFTVPPVFWFKGLTEGLEASEQLRFGLASARAPDGAAGCQLLIALHGREAHYLFGHQWRTPNTRAAVSPSAVAQRLAVRHCAEAGYGFYDFNGYVEGISPEHPYSGVSQFKAQFGASLVEYEVPELLISH